MAKRNIGKKIIQGLEEIKAWKQGKVKLRTFTVNLPRAADVSAIRKELGLSQDQFAHFMGVSVARLRSLRSPGTSCGRKCASLPDPLLGTPRRRNARVHGDIPATRGRCYPSSGLRTPRPPLLSTCV